MPQDDVTSTTPLRGGRQKANHIQVMRIEMGLAERKAILVPIASILQEVQESAQTFKVIRTGAIAAAGVASLGAVYVGWRIGKSLYGWVDEIADIVKLPIENTQAILDGDPETKPVMGLGESFIFSALKILGY